MLPDIPGLSPEFIANWQATADDMRAQAEARFAGILAVEPVPYLDAHETGVSS